MFRNVKLKHHSYVDSIESDRQKIPLNFLPFFFKCNIKMFEVYILSEKRSFLHNYCLHIQMFSLYSYYRLNEQRFPPIGTLLKYWFRQFSLYIYVLMYYPSVRTSPDLILWMSMMSIIVIY